MDVYEWVEMGVEQGFCSPTACATHDGIPEVGDEGQQWEDGGDPCQHVVRLLHPGEQITG